MVEEKIKQELKGNGVKKQSLFILHSLNGNTEHSFKDSVSSVGRELGFDVFYPRFQTSQNMSYENFREVMDSYGDCFNENTVVIAHSISANYLIKYISENGGGYSFSNFSGRCFGVVS